LTSKLQVRELRNHPLFGVFIEVIADPKIVADWPFAG
jgi:hypothetical protein